MLTHTVERAIQTATDPSALHFGIVDQNSSSALHPFANGIPQGKLTYVRIDSTYARGPCWARALAMTLYSGEDWFFQIDSHTDFEMGWDETFIRHALELGPKAVLSSYPNPFVIQGGIAVYQPCTTGVLSHVVKRNAQFTSGISTLAFEAHPITRNTPIRAFHIGAGCLFTNGSIVYDVPYDPWYYFHGEEQAFALRLFTHGWNIWHIPKQPTYHMYNASSMNTMPRTLHWDKDQDSNRTDKWWTLEKSSQRRLNSLVAGESLGNYGLGNVRTIEQYAQFSGIDYQTRTVDMKAYNPTGR